MEDRLQVGVVRMGCAAVLAGAGWAGAQPVALPPAPAGVEVTREQGFEFVTVRGGPQAYAVTPEMPVPGGTNTLGIGYRFLDGTQVGRVDESYRISRTEVTAGQYIEMLNMYIGQRTYDGWRTDPLFAAFIDNSVSNEGEYGLDEQGNSRVFRYVIGPLANRPVYLSHVESMLYINWLHHGRPTDLNVIRTGVYDAARFITLDLLTSNAPGPQRLTIAPAAGARFFIPTQDQWIRAAHFDPNRNGPGQGGFWQFPNGTDSPSIPGPPGVGSANIGWDYDPSVGGGRLFAGDIDIASYPDTQSPWGLLDTSGNGREWTSTVMYWPDEPSPGDHVWRGWGTVIEGGAAGGSAANTEGAIAQNLLDHIGYFDPNGLFPVYGVFGATRATLRIAAVVPGPTGACVSLCFVFFTLFRRSR